MGIIINSIEFDQLTADPSPLSDGMVWYRSDLNELRKRINGVTVIDNANSIPFTSTQQSNITANNSKVSFPEAPQDGTQYARKDAGWEAVAGGTPADASETVKGILELATQTETNTGTDDLRAVTPLKLKNWEHLITDTVYAYNMASTAGTFNGLSAIRAGAATLFGRWYFRSFANGNPNPKKVAYFNRSLPSNYKAGSDITFKIHTTNSTISGYVRWHLGMTQPTVTDDYGGGANTEWVVQNVAVPTAGTWRKQIHTVTFSGTGLVAGDELSFIMMRESTNAGDTNSGTAYINQASVEITIKG